MDLQRFETHLEKLMAWFNKNLDENQIPMFYRKVSFIPTEAFIEIVDRLTETQKPIPSNFPTPQAIKDNYRIWLMENPAKRVNLERSDCDECVGTGFIWVRINHSLHYSTECCFRCEKCKNWSEHVSSHIMPSITKQKALERGFRLVHS